VLITIGFLLLGGLAYMLGSNWAMLFRQPVFHAVAEAGCDLRAGPCVAAVDMSRSIRLDMTPRPLPPTEQLRIRVDTSGLTAESIAVEFRGIDMNMGKSSHELRDIGGGSFTGDASLPACTRRQMRWRATVTARGADGIYLATFDFEVNRP
jgi:hypothetical protein